MRRLVLVLATSGLALLLLSTQASAHTRQRDYVSMRATVTGPGLARPLVLRGKLGSCEQQRGNRFWNFAVWSGASGSDIRRGFVPTDQRPHVDLGQRYLVRFTSEGRTAHVDVYPFAAGGPWTYIPPSQVAAIRAVLHTTVYNTQSGWWHASGATGSGLLGILRIAGFVSHGPPVPSAAVPRGQDTPWAVAAVAVLLLLLAIEARRGRRGVAPPRPTLTYSAS
jgi:hypothetical protein